jgi:hypothetical protein
MRTRIVALVILALAVFVAVGLPLAAIAQDVAPPPPVSADELAAAIWNLVVGYVAPGAGGATLLWATFRAIVKTVLREVRVEAEEHVKTLAALARVEMHKAIAECPPIRVVVVEPTPAPAAVDGDVLPMRRPTTG